MKFLKIVIRYPNGVRKTVRGMIEDDILYRVNMLRWKKEAFELDINHVEVQQSGIGKLLGINHTENVVDVDYNAHSTMSVIEEKLMITLPKGTKIKRMGKTIKTTCSKYPDDKKKNFYQGIAMKKMIEAEKKGFDAITYVSGIGTGAILFKILQSLLATQNVLL